MRKLLAGLVVILALTIVLREEVPAFAGMTEKGAVQGMMTAPACAGMTEKGAVQGRGAKSKEKERGEARGNQALTGVVNESLPDKLRLLWSFKAGDEIKASPVVSGNIVVAGSMDGFVYALDKNGKLLWKVGTGNGIEAPALILDDVVYIGNLTGVVFALNLTDGKEIWQYKTEGQISGSVNWWKSGNSIRLIVGSYDYNLHCIDAATGKNIWKYESDNFINGAAACVNGTAIFGGCDGFLHVVNIATGMAEAKIDVATYVPGSAPTAGGLVFVGDYDGGLSCASIAEKKIVWKYTSEKTQLPFVASAALPGDRVITGCRDKQVYCFSKADGKLIWKYNTGEKVDASPLVCQDKVLVANMRGDLILLKLSDGNPVSAYELGSPVFSNPAVSGGRVFTGAADGNIYCLGK